MIDFSNPKKGTELELPELASSRELSGVRFVVENTFHGGMGICLKLRHVGTNDAFSLKVIKPEFLGEQTTWARFIEELKWWLTLSACEGVAEAHCISRVNEIPCMCAAWLHHGNLRQFIGHGKPEFAFQTMLRIVRTLEWAYTKHNVIHRDLKPENILLDQDGRAFVSDWGLAKALNFLFEESRRSSAGAAAGSPQLTQAGHIVGTMLYAAPEQILGLPTIDHRADIYSLGCILFEWETGHPPFMGRGHMEVARQHVQVPPPKLGGLLHKTSLGLEDVIARCLEKDPGKRFQDYDGLAQAMLSVAKHRTFRVADFHPTDRYYRAKPGSGGLQKQLKAIKYSPQGYAWIDEKEVLKHFDQAMAESSLGNHAKAAKILAPFYIAEMCREIEFWTIYHTIAVNYGLFLSQSRADQREALGVFNSLLVVEPKSPAFFVNYSLALLRNQEFTKAESVASQGLVINPKDGDLLGNLSNALRLQGKLSEALNVAKQRLAIGKDVHALEEAGIVLKELGDAHEEDWPKATGYYKSALANLVEAKKLNPRYIVARFAMAMVLQKLYRFGDACDECQAIREFAENRSQYETAVILMAELLADVKSYRECIDLCDEWIPKLTILEHKARMERTRGKVLVDHFMIGMEREGVRAVQEQAVLFFQSRVSSPQTPSVEDLLYWARINEWMGHPKQALEIAERALHSAPNGWEACGYKAQFLSRLGNHQDAILAAQKSIELAPYRPEPIDNLVRIHQCAGNQEAADAAKIKADEIFALRKKLCA